MFLRSRGLDQKMPGLPSSIHILANPRPSRSARSRVGKNLLMGWVPCSVQIITILGCHCCVSRICQAEVVIVSPLYSSFMTLSPRLLPSTARHRDKSTALVVPADNCYLSLVDLRTLLVILFGIVLPALFIVFFLIGQ